VKYYHEVISHKINKQSNRMNMKSNLLVLIAWLLLSTEITGRHVEVVGEGDTIINSNDATTDLVTSRTLKVSKKTKSHRSRSEDLKQKRIEGDYVYSGCNNNVFFVSIVCGLFGLNDPDLCLFEEFPVGKISDVEEDGAIPLDGNNDVFFVPNEKFKIVTESDSVPVADPNEDCVSSGTFRSSTVEKDGRILPIPLATSNGCKSVINNFEFVVKGQTSSDDSGNIKLDFSKNGGLSYYTDDVTCPQVYNASPITTKDDDRSDRRLNEHDRRLPSVTTIIPVLSTTIAPFQLPPGVDLIWTKSDGGSFYEHMLYNTCSDEKYMLSLVVAHTHSYAVLSPNEDDTNDTICPTLIMHSSWNDIVKKNRLEKSIHTIDDEEFSAKNMASVEAYLFGEYSLKVIMDAFHLADDGSDIPYHKTTNNCSVFLINMGKNLGIDIRSRPTLGAYIARHVNDANGPNTIVHGRALKRGIVGVGECVGFFGNSIGACIGGTTIGSFVGGFVGG